MCIEPKLSIGEKVSCCGTESLWTPVAFMEPTDARPRLIAYFFCVFCLTLHLHADCVSDFKRWMAKPAEERVNVWDRIEDLIES